MLDVLIPLAINYCGTCNVNDSLLCQYAQCNVLDFEENFESNDLNVSGWSIYSGSQSNVLLTNLNAISDSISLEFTGGNSWGSISQYTI